RERLRKEKELLGLYLAEHPMGEVAEQVGDFATAYSGDLKDESLDGQRMVIAGIVTGFRRVSTKANAAVGMAAARRSSAPSAPARSRSSPSSSSRRPRHGPRARSS